jgi:hypothetical protein
MPGAARMKALYTSLTVVERIAIFSSVFIIGFAYGTALASTLDDLEGSDMTE